MVYSPFWNTYKPLWYILLQFLVCCHKCFVTVSHLSYEVSYSLIRVSLIEIFLEGFPIQPMPSQSSNRSVGSVSRFLSFIVWELEFQILFSPYALSSWLKSQFFYPVTLVARRSRYCHSTFFHFPIYQLIILPCI